MSARNGQRARFHRNRKRRVLLRMKVRAVMQEIVSKREPAAKPAASLRAAPAGKAKS